MTILFHPTEQARCDLLASIPATFNTRFYEPKIHGIDLKARFASEHPRLMQSDQFSYDVNALLTEVDAYPIEVFHETERLIGLWKAIGLSSLTSTRYQERRLLRVLRLTRSTPVSPSRRWY